MEYKTVVVPYAPKSKVMAANIEQAANDMVKEGWELVTTSITQNAKAILVFKKEAQA